MATLQGLMQDTPLVVSDLLAYAVRVHGDREIVSRTIEDPSVVHRCALAMQDRTSLICRTSCPRTLVACICDGFTCAGTPMAMRESGR